MSIHIVRQGEHLTSIAERYRLAPDTIWNDSGNDELRRTRDNPHMLAPGDRLTIPTPPPPRPLQVQAESTNRYRARVPRVTLDVDLQSGSGPIEDQPFEVHGAGAVITGNTTSGRVRCEVPNTAREVRLVLPRAELEYRLVVGGLDPIEEETGVFQRLAHLGFSSLPLHDEEGPGTAQGGRDAVTAPEDAPIPPDIARDPRRRAIAAFQHYRGLTVTGAMDDATRSALRDAYGS